MSNETGPTPPPITPKATTNNTSIRGSPDQAKSKAFIAVRAFKNMTKRHKKKVSNTDNTRSETESREKAKIKSKQKKSTKKKVSHKENLTSPNLSSESPALPPIIAPMTPRTPSINEDSKSKSKSEKQMSSDQKRTKEPWFGLDAGRKWVDDNMNMEKLSTEFATLQAIDAKKPATVFASFPMKNRNEKNIVYDENRVVLNRSKMGAPNYINASRINVSNFKCSVLVAQVPINKKEDAEDFWHMIYQEKVSFLFLASNRNQTESFFPEKKDEFVYYGKMFVNNKKTEVFKRMEVLTVEVLPNGNSDSIICKILHLSRWGIGQRLRISLNIKTIMDEFLSEIKIQENVTICTVSMNGNGRACATLAAVVANTALSRGSDPNIFNIMKEIKEQRYGATENFCDYAAVYLFVTRYIKSNTQEDSQLQQKVNTMIKALTIMTTDNNVV